MFQLCPQTFLRADQEHLLFKKRSMVPHFVHDLLWCGTHPFPSPPFLLLHLSSSQPLSLRAAHFIRAPSRKQQQQTIIHTQRTLCRGRSGQWHLRERERQTERGRESDSTWHTAPLWQRDFDWLAVWRRILEDNAALLILFTPFSASRLSSRRPLMVF